MFWLILSSLKNDSFMIDQLYWLGEELVKYFTQLRSPNFTWEKLVNRFEQFVIFLQSSTLIQTQSGYFVKTPEFGKFHRICNFSHLVCEISLEPKNILHKCHLCHLWQIPCLHPSKHKCLSRAKDETGLKHSHRHTQSYMLFEIFQMLSKSLLNIISTKNMSL